MRILCYQRLSLVRDRFGHAVDHLNTRACGRCSVCQPQRLKQLAAELVRDIVLDVLRQQLGHDARELRGLISGGGAQNSLALITPNAF